MSVSMRSPFTTHIVEIAVYYRTAVGSIDDLLASDVIANKAELPEDKRTKIGNLSVIAEKNAATERESNARR